MDREAVRLPQPLQFYMLWRHHSMLKSTHLQEKETLRMYERCEAAIIKTIMAAL